MNTTTICLMKKGKGKVLLAMKKKGFGAGRWNGYGGKPKPKDKSIRHTAIREIREESCLSVYRRWLIPVAHFVFYFAKEPKVESFVFICDRWKGEPQDTEEMGPHRWCDCDNLPVRDRKDNLTMWPADPLWIPLVILGGEKIEGEIFFDREGNEVRKWKFRKVASLDF